MLRTRDIVALVAVLILTRMAWNDSTESLEASAHLAFYVSREKGAAVSPMDVDGDGTNEALAVVQQSSSNLWEWKVLDLKALHPRKGKITQTALPPFPPSTLFSTKDNDRGPYVSPLQVVTGQVLVKADNRASRKKMDLSNVKADTEINDRNRHYFCGNDWHDAAQKCSHPCPSGQASECPDDQRCYADTPCDFHAENKEDTQTLFELTPGGGLPSIVTLWSDGLLAMNSLTTREDASLSLNSMWRKQLLPEASDPQNILWFEHKLLFLDSYDSIETLGATHGMIVVSGVYIDEGELGSESEDEEEIMKTMKTFIIAVDAMKGKILWDTFTEDQKEEEPLPFPLARGGTSYARRRSRIPTLNQILHGTQLHNLPDCRATYRRQLKHILPYAYWTSKDSQLTALHLEHAKKRQHKGPGGKHPGIGKEPVKLPTQEKKRWLQNFQKRKNMPIRGRPNVLLTQTKGGLQVRSIRNGRPICHMSLLENTLYADLNNDGNLDQVQVLLSGNDVDHNDKWVRTLIAKLEKNKVGGKPKDEARSARMSYEGGSNLCHAMALSGMPAREELFSVSLCGNAYENMSAHPSLELDSVAPVVVESLSGRRNTRDVIVALNNGMVHRLQGRSGRKEWMLAGLQYDNFPTWEDSSTGNAVMTRIQSDNIPPPLRPVLLAGENSLAVLSVKNGKILATATYPQTSIARPILAEVSGDGTTDVIVTSLDGIWGFKVQVRAGRPVILRILVGLLIFSLMLAILRNQFGGQRKDVRATDL